MDVKKMIYGIGIDLVEIPRIEKIIKDNPRFVRRVLTPNELELFESFKGRRQCEFFAGRFSCKEAFSKAYGTGIGKLTLQDIEILSEPNGRPIVTASPFTGNIHVSISHTENYAISQIILEK